MNKILVEVSAPKIDQKFDCFVPINKNFYTIAFLLEKIISEIIDNTNFKINTICNKETGAIYDLNTLVKETDLQNGTKLIIF